MTLTSLVFSFCPLKGVYELLPRVELGTSSLPRMRSTTELKQHFLLLRRGRSLLSERRDSNPRPPAWKASALSTELLSQGFALLTPMWVRMDSNHRRRKPADLQSAPFGHSGTHPHFKVHYSKFTIFSLAREPLVGLEPTTAGLQI